MRRSDRDALPAAGRLARPPRPDSTRRRRPTGAATTIGTSEATYPPTKVPRRTRACRRRAFSVLLVGRGGLDAVLAKRLRDALLADNAQFDQQAQALLDLIERGRIEPLQLQRTLDDERSPLATLPRAIVMAWYPGIVGDPVHARCIAHESARNAVVVADVLKLPSYCYGEYGNWARKPA